jgi:hypothetical protein
MKTSGGNDNHSNRKANRCHPWIEAQSMGDTEDMLKEIGQLRTLASLNTVVLAEIEALIRALERRIRLSGNGQPSHV